MSENTADLLIRNVSAPNPQPRELGSHQRKWVEALRSGEFKQTTSYLHWKEEGKSSFCCLGVACELALRDGVKLLVTSADIEDSSEEGAVSYDTEYDSLPASVVEWLGIIDWIGTLPTGLTKLDELSLATLNDNGKNFNEIADIIEKYADDLFTEVK